MKDLVNAGTHRIPSLCFYLLISYKMIDKDVVICFVN